MNEGVQDADIPVKIWKRILNILMNFDEYFEYFQSNKATFTSKFSASFKFANVTLNFKQGSRNQKL